MVLAAKLLGVWCCFVGARASLGVARPRAAVFGADDLEHPFSSLARSLCVMDDSLNLHGMASIRRALLALSLQSKAAKGLDGMAHGISSLGASAASGSSVSERLAAARDSKRTSRSLRARAAAAARAEAIADAFEALEWISTGRKDADGGQGSSVLHGGTTIIDGVLAADVIEDEEDSDSSEIKIVLRWVGDGVALFDALDSEMLTRHAIFGAASREFLRLATKVRDEVLLPRLFAAATNEDDDDDDVSQEGGESKKREKPRRYAVFGHGAAGSVGALLAGLLASSSPDSAVRAVCLGPAPCASRRHYPGVARITSVVLGDDLVARSSRSSLRRLRRRLRRFLPIKGQKHLSFFGLGAAVASSTLASMAGTVTPTADDDDHDEIKLHLPGHVFFLKPRADGSVVAYALKTENPKQGARADLLWQLNDLFLSKSMLAHHSLDAYLQSLDRA